VINERLLASFDFGVSGYRSNKRAHTSWRFAFDEFD
jgi:hypothetical protein